MEQNNLSLFKKILSLCAVIVFSICAVKFSSIDVLIDFLPHGLSTSLFKVFEHNFWQFVYGFVAIVLLSRGHLWSYGINSKNLKISMKFLLWLYLFTIVEVIIFQFAGTDYGAISSEMAQRNIKNSLLIILIYWMSAPIANTILFFGFGQTVLLKYVDSSIKIFTLPVSIVLSTVIYTFFATSVQISGLGIFSIILTFSVGLYSGIVYWKTGSLITSMLGQAFFYGLPIVVAILKFPS